MLVSTNLCSIPFLGHTDNTRLQMSAKQLSQAVTNPLCEVPKIIGKEFRYLGDSTRLFKMTAPCSGDVLYVNDEIMMVIFNDHNIGFEVYNITPIMQCSGLYSARLRYRRQEGPFKAGDLLYEYDCFKQGIPTYGYNLLTAYMPFFGFNHEDAIVLSESAARKCRSTKMEQIIIPIYTYSLFKNAYNNDIGFIPNVGEKIKGNVIAFKSQLKDHRNPYQALKSMNITNFANAVNNELEFNSIPIYSRIENGTVVDVRVHSVNREQLVDKNLMNRIAQIRKKYSDYLSSVSNQLSQILPTQHIRETLIRNYVLNVHSVKAFQDYDIKNLVYLVELTISGESQTKIGDKFANRYANKGVISMVLPDELRPYTEQTGLPIDSIVGPISVISRMNFGQVIEGILSKIIMMSEYKMINAQSSKEVSDELNKLSHLSALMNEPEYSEQIHRLALDVENNPDTHRQFLSSINEIGLYFEAPNFANFNIAELEEFGRDYGTPCNENVIIPRKTVQYMNDKLTIDMPVPNEDIVMPNVFTSWIYTIKLKQEASSRITSRDFGTYKATNKQPSKGRTKDGHIGGSSRLGHMEFDGLLAHSAVHTMQELRTVKNDIQSLKTDLATQIITSGAYDLPKSKNITSYTKLIIDSLMNFINS